MDKYLLQSYLSDELEAHRAAKQARRKRRREAMETAFRRRVEGKLDILSTIAQSLEKARAALDDGIDPDEEALAGTGRSWRTSLPLFTARRNRSAPVLSDGTRLRCVSSAAIPPQRPGRSWERPSSPCVNCWSAERPKTPFCLI